MEKELHILILEDLPSDAELAKKELKTVLKNYMVKVVDTEKEFIQALATFKPDLIISDYQLPAFDGLSALQMTRDKSPFTPFVILTGSKNEDTAVECIKAGADDYVIKEHIKRLGPAVLNALENKKIELERKKAESELQIERDKLTAIFESMADGIYVVNKDYDIQYVNSVLKRTFGSPEGKKCHKYFHDSAEPCTFCKNEDVFAGKTVHWEWTSTKYGKTYDLIDTPIKNADGSISKLEIFRDITERKQAEEKIEKLQSLRNAISDINQLLVRVKSESELFQQTCNLLIKVKDIRFAWIGLTNNEDYKVKPVAQAGFEKGYLSSIKITWDDSKYGNGPTGIALKTSQPFTMRNIEDDPKFKPWKNNALKRGYLSSIALPLLYKKETIGALNVYSGIKDAFTNEEVKFLKEVSEDITIGIRSLRLELKLQQSYHKLQKTLEATIETVSRIVEVKDPYTAGHQLRVSQLTTTIAKELNLSPDKVEGIRIASLIHDIGKISVPTEILSKSTTLSNIEFSLIKEHSRIGYDILKAIDFSYPVANIVLQHHERINGSGYPGGLKRDEILLEAKILCVADVVEAMSSHRPYRPALGIDAALEEISQNKGILYDPKVVDICLKLFKEKRFKFE